MVCEMFEDLWKACADHFDAALAQEFEDLNGTGTSPRTFIMTHRYEVLAFISEANLTTVMESTDHLAKFAVLQSHWESTVIVRTLFKEKKRDVDYANYRDQVVQIVDDAVAADEDFLEARLAVFAS